MPEPIAEPDAAQAGWRRWVKPTLLTIGALVVIWLSAKPPIQKCLQEEKAAGAYQPDPERSGFFGNLDFCGWIFLRENTEAILALATIGLMFYTARLWYTTRSMAKDAGNTARQAIADNKEIRRIMGEQHTAMKATATAAVASEKAYVFLNTTETEKKPHNAGRARSPGDDFYLFFINLGKTPAEIESMLVSFRVWRLPVVRSLTEHPRVDTPTPLNFWLGPGGSSKEQKISMGTPQPLVDGSPDGADVPVVLCRVRFRDIFDARWETGFAIQIAQSGLPGFSPIHNDNLNYTRRYTE